MWINNYGDEFDTLDEAYQDAEETLNSEDICAGLLTTIPQAKFWNGWAISH